MSKFIGEYPDTKKCELVNGFPLGNKDHFKPHQRAELLRMGDAGAVAGLLVEAVAVGKYLWLPWQEMTHWKLGTVRWLGEMD